MTLHRYLLGSRIIAAWIQAGGVFVTQELTEQRSDTCLKCPQNTPGKFMGIIGWIAVRLAEWRSRNRVVNRLEAGLKTCGVCGCPLRLRVKMPIDEIAKGIDLRGGELAKFPKPCWIVQELVK